MTAHHLNLTPLEEFAMKHARRDDPETSKLAAESAPSLAFNHQRKILAYLRSINVPVTVEQIAAGTCIEKHAVGKRMKELADAGFIRELGIARMSNGRMGRTWSLA